MICCNSLGVQVPPVMERKAKSRHTQRVNQTSDGAGFFLTEFHFPALANQLSQQRQPPTILSRNHVAFVTPFEGFWRVGPWTKLKLILNIAKIFISDTTTICTSNSWQDSNATYFWFQTPGKPSAWAALLIWRGQVGSQHQRTLLLPRIHFLCGILLQVPVTPPAAHPCR